MHTNITQTCHIGACAESVQHFLIADDVSRLEQEFNVRKNFKIKECTRIYKL